MKFGILIVKKIWQSNSSVRGTCYTRKDSEVNIWEGEGIGNHAKWSFGSSLGCFHQGPGDSGAYESSFHLFRKQHVDVKGCSERLQG